MPIQKRTRIIFTHRKTLAKASNKDSFHQTKNSYGNFTFIQKKGKMNDLFLHILLLASGVLCEYERKKKNSGRF